MIELIGYCAAGLTTHAFVPQVFLTWRSKSADDLSLTTMAAFTMGVFFGLKLRHRHRRPGAVSRSHFASRHDR
ncbi:MAG TPA: PQ-loop domain-containing transporter [Vicinamibacterales bacterium]|jgi:hypothetical protein|nr:PQ-loop domain-containing transporter [Vicinamibacterales bacterium]